MEISIKISQSGLDEMRLNVIGLTEHIIETLDADDKELVGYNVNVVVSD